jgi:hypothetical protein
MVGWMSVLVLRITARIMISLRLMGSWTYIYVIKMLRRNIGIQTPTSAR